MRDIIEMDLREFVSHLILLGYVRFEVIMVMRRRRMMFFWVLMPCRLVGRYL
jgi:hypothetical protein